MYLRRLTKFSKGRDETDMYKLAGTVIRLVK